MNKNSYAYAKNCIESVKGYKMLSTTYINSRTKITVQCDKGHIYDVRLASFNQGCRCPECYSKNKKYLYKNVKEIIESEEGYSLLSDYYNNIKQLLSIRCKNGHLFNMRFTNFLQGRRCPCCSNQKHDNGKVQGYIYEEVKEYIESHDGCKLISTEYTNSNTKIDIQCREGHIFKMRFRHFQRGQRCPECGESKGEQRIRQWLINNNNEYKIEYTFDNLKSLKNNLLRFDFAVFKNDDLMYLIEYDGRQHFECVEWMTTKKDFEILKYHDKLKDMYCQNNNISLLRIPYWDYDNIEEILNQYLKQNSKEVINI